MPMRGELGCYASHYLMWQKCVEINEPIIILEDDIKISPMLVEYLADIKHEVSSFGFCACKPHTKEVMFF